MSEDGHRSRLEDIFDRYQAGFRLGSEDALLLYRRADLLELSQMAHAMRLRKHPGDIVTYIVGRNINYTNVCWVRCGFCAFYRRPG
ncbi:MAG: dehypoxanthine futalosine cyclase, partial [Acidobacteria bacterium]|nr:dehypoxanthine futalosine cyclase [Acidobacteriota bacterium]